MTISERIIKAIKPIVPICVPNLYKGKALEYTTFTYSEFPDLHADGVPGAIRYLCILTYVCASKKNVISTRQKLKRAILAAGGTYPMAENISDDKSQIWALEFEMEDGDV